MSLTIYRFNGQELAGNTAIERILVGRNEWLYTCDWCGATNDRSASEGEGRRYVRCLYHYGFIRQTGTGVNAAFCCKSCAESYVG